MFGLEKIEKIEKLVKDLNEKVIDLEAEVSVLRGELIKLKK